MQKSCKLFYACCPVSNGLAVNQVGRVQLYQFILSVHIMWQICMKRQNKFDYHLFFVETMWYVRKYEKKVADNNHWIGNIRPNTGSDWISGTSLVWNSSYEVSVALDCQNYLYFLDINASLQQRKCKLSNSAFSENSVHCSLRSFARCELVV